MGPINSLAHWCGIVSFVCYWHLYLEWKQIVYSGKWCNPGQRAMSQSVSNTVCHHNEQQWETEESWLGSRNRRQIGKSEEVTMRLLLFHLTYRNFSTPKTSTPGLPEIWLYCIKETLSYSSLSVFFQCKLYAYLRYIVLLIAVLCASFIFQACLSPVIQIICHYIYFEIFSITILILDIY